MGTESILMGGGRVGSLESRFEMEEFLRREYLRKLQENVFLDECVKRHNR